MTKDYIGACFSKSLMAILNKQQQQAKQVFDEKIRDLAFKKNITFAEARKMIESNQSDLGSFRFR